MQLYKLLIVSVFSELHLGRPVTAYAPSHAERLDLPDAVHGFYIAMALLALHFARNDMLGVVEIGMIREIVDFDPFNGFPGFNSAVDLGNFRRSRIAAASYSHMAVHAQANRRNARMLADRNAQMAIFTINLVITCVDFMGEKDRLIGFITRLPAKILSFHNSNFSNDAG